MESELDPEEMSQSHSFRSGSELKLLPIWGLLTSGVLAQPTKVRGQRYEIQTLPWISGAFPKGRREIQI